MCRKTPPQGGVLFFVDSIIINWNEIIQEIRGFADIAVAYEYARRI